MKLNLGSGGLPFDDYVNVDVRDDIPGVDIVSDVRKLDMKDGISDEVFAKDVIEHMPRREWKDTLKEWCRLIRPGGLLKIRFPDMLLLFKYYMNDGFNPIRVYGGKYEYSDHDAAKWAVERLGQLLFGDQDVPENSHLSGLTKDLVIEELEILGMTVIKSWIEGCADIRITASKGEADPNLDLGHPDYRK